MPEPPNPESPSSALHGPIRACARGELPANVALAQAAIAASSSAEVEQALAYWIAVLDSAGDGRKAARLRSARALWFSAPDAWQVLRAVFRVAGQQSTGATEEEAIAQWSARFDRAVQISPAAGVALYSLGCEELLETATAEVVAYMRERKLLGQGRVAVEIGCGIGRLLRALAGELRLIVGIDVSPLMLAEARRRLVGVSGPALLRGSGRDLAAFRDKGVDFVYSVDAFPYLVDAGDAVAARHVAEAWRILRPGGALLILNYSYRGDPAADCTEVARAAEGNGFTLVENGATPFAHWDGRAFLMRKQAQPGRPTISPT